jgi:hypothetical protein
MHKKALPGRRWHKNQRRIRLSSAIVQRDGEMHNKDLIISRLGVVGGGTNDVAIAAGKAQYRGLLVVVPLAGDPP